MKIPTTRVTSVGAVSPWGRQFLYTLQEEGVFDFIFEPNVNEFCQSFTQNQDPIIIFIENLPECRAWIMALKQSCRSYYLVWFGRNFSKEDYAFAMEYRIYSVFENPKTDDRKFAEKLIQLIANREQSSQFEHVVRSMKSLIVQSEDLSGAKSLVQELKSAIVKLEKCNIQNEFNHSSFESSLQSESRLPFYRTQDFADALFTVHDLERTGTLWVRGGHSDQEAKVDFLQGKLIFATTGDARGLKAIYRIFLWDEPKFLFVRSEPKDCVLDEEVNISVKYICQEGQAYKKRFSAMRHELPPKEIVLELDPKTLNETVQLSPNDFFTLSSIVEFQKVSEVIDYNPLPDVIIFESLIVLKKSKMIRIAA